MNLLEEYILLAWWGLLAAGVWLIHHPAALFLLSLAVAAAMFVLWTEHCERRETKHLKTRLRQLREERGHWHRTTP
jgi:membrane protein implicated in regulation of membrane protease activity